MADSEDDLQEPRYDSDDSDYTEAPTRPRKRLRKSKSNANVKSASTSRRRKSRGVASLSELMNMPIDVVFEIASHLHPLDLLQLTRTSKTLRSTLLSRNSVYVWRATLESVEGLPKCPEDMSEPFYAALLFDKICFFCGGDRANWVDFAIRLRLCKTCCKENILTGSTILKGMRAVADLLHYVPCETGTKLWHAEHVATTAHHSLRYKYYVSDVHAMISRYYSLPKDKVQADAILNEQEAKVALRHQQAIPILHYMNNVVTEKKQAIVNTKTARSASIVANLQELGYAETDFPANNDTWNKLVYQSKDLTDRIWSNIRPKLEELIEEERERQRKAAFKARVAKRHTQIYKLYEEFLKENLPDERHPMTPNVVDIRCLPCLHHLSRKDNAEGEVTREEFLAVTDDLLEELDVYENVVRKIAINTLSAAYGAEALEPFGDKVLDSYFAYFHCNARSRWGMYFYKEHPRPHLTFADIHAHWRHNHPKLSFISKNTERGYETFRPASSMLDFGRRILDAAGLPHQTPRVTLDELVSSGRLYCNCGDPSMPPPEKMDWLSLFKHVSEHKSLYKDQSSRWDPDVHHGFVVMDNHKLSGPDCCIKLLEEGADTAPAATRVKIDDALRAKIQARLAVEQDVEPLCRMCKTVLTSSSRYSLFRYPPDSCLPDTPEGIVYHLRGRHGKDFEDRDVAFITS